MCGAYIAAGLPPDRFWTLTPRLYMVEMRGAADRLDRQRRERIEEVWLGAKLQRAKDIPSLNKLLPPPPGKSRKMSRDEMQAMFDAMAASMGAKMQ